MRRITQSFLMLGLSCCLCVVSACAPNRVPSGVSPGQAAVASGAVSGVGRLGINVRLPKRSASGLETQAVDTRLIKKLDIEIWKTGDSTPLASRTDVSVETESISELFSDVPSGTNRIIKVYPKDVDGNKLLLLMGATDILPDQTSIADVNIGTTPLARVLEALPPACAVSVNKSALAAFISNVAAQVAGTSTLLVDPTKVATAVLNNSCAPPALPTTDMLMEAGRIRVTVVDELNNLVTDARVYVNDPLSRVVENQMSGIYQFYPVSPNIPGAEPFWTAYALTESGRFASGQVSVQPGETADITLQLTPLNSIHMIPPAMTMQGVFSQQLMVRANSTNGPIIPSVLLAWSSGNEAVAPVGSSEDDAGIVTAISDGTSIITAALGALTTTCNVTVNLISNRGATLIETATSGLTLNPAGAVNFSQLGQTIQLTPLEPGAPVDTTYTWFTNRPDLVTVDQNGLIRAVADFGGTTATITAYSTTGRNATKTVGTTGNLNQYNQGQVAAGANSDQMAIEALSTTNAGDPDWTSTSGGYINQKEATVSIRAVDPGMTSPVYYWFSSNPTIIEVTGAMPIQTATLLSHAAGSATITAINSLGRSRSVTVAVSPGADPLGSSRVAGEAPGREISIGNLVGTLNDMNQTATLTATYNSADVPTFYWFSSNPAAVVVDSASPDSKTVTLRVTGAGSSTITVIDSYGKSVTKDVTATLAPPTYNNAQVTQSLNPKVLVRRTEPSTPAEANPSDGVTLVPGRTTTLVAEDTTDTNPDWAWFTDSEFGLQVISQLGSTAVVRGNYTGTYTVTAVNGRTGNRSSKTVVVSNSSNASTTVNATF